MHVFAEKPIREAKVKWPRAASALEQWYRSQKLYIKHVLDHREYERGKWKEGKV